MNIIPTINVKTKEEAELAIEKLKLIEPAWVQFDISDGRFSETVSWNNPKEAMEIISLILPNVLVEAHLMVQDQKTNACAWIDVGVGRVIVHSEALDGETFGFINEYAKKHNAHVMVALSPDTNIEVINKFNGVNEVQVLAVHPGPSGQEFIPSMVEKIKELKKINPHFYIEVDGGMNKETIQLVRDVGVDGVAMGAYLSKSDDIVGSFKELFQ